MTDSMIEIDGSFGEGGGQIVRTAVSLSAVTARPVHISKIRQGRPRPGLAAQHAHAITALAGICSAKTSGVKPGSSEVVFVPGEIRGGSYRVEIGTAGSVTLLMQCLLPALLQADAPVSLQVQGGTDVQWSPTVDYFKSVFLPALSSFGADVKLQLVQRGYYPRGQGTVILEVVPGELKAANFLSRRQGLGEKVVQGISHSSNLPLHVTARQAEAAANKLLEAGYEAEVTQEVLKLPSTGSGITLWSQGMGASCLGERGLAAEKVGRRAAEELIEEMKSIASIDVHLADQLVLYIALAGGSYTVREVSLHASTNIWTVGHFLDAEISVKENDGVFRVVSSTRD